jgi:quinol monooxygenase YgiN
LVLEIAHVIARAGEEDALAADYQAAIDAVLKHPGASRARVFRQREDPRVFTLLIEWDSVEEHQDFTASPLIHQFRACIGGRVETGSAGHYDLIADGD